MKQSIGCLVALLGCCAPIQAQQDSSTVHELKEVIVTDSYEASRKRKQPLNIEIVNKNYIRQQLGGSLMQSLEKLPGIKAIGIGSGNSKPLIRGLGFNQVVVVENGIKHEGQQWGADHGLEIDQYAVSQLEIIKGPAAFLYGSDAIGGAIDIKAAPLPARHTISGAIDLSGKSNNDQWAVSAQLAARTEKWFVSARFTATDYADFKVPTDTVHVYNYPAALHNRRVRNSAGHERNIHLSTGWTGPRFSSIFYGSRTYSRSGFFANAHGLEPRQVDAALHDRSARDIQLPAQEVTHTKLINRTSFRLGQHALEWQTGYQKNFRQEYNRYINHGYMPPVYPASHHTPIELERQYNKSVLSSTLKDEWQQGRHQLTIGANAEYQENRIDGWSFLIPAFTQFQSGVYLHDRLQLNDQLTAQLALRFDHGQIRIREYADWFTTPVVNGPDTSYQYLQRSVNSQRSFNSLNWSAGISYAPGALTLKANLGSSFRMPIAKELGANGVNYHYFRYEKGNSRLDPERSYQLDLGIGWNQPDWSFLLSPYLNYFPNYIYLNPTARHDYDYGAGNQVFEYTQAKVLRTGAELQARYQPDQHWQTTLAAEYLYSEQQSGSKQGYTLPFTPPPSTLLTVQYLFTDNKKAKDSYIGVNWRFSAQQSRIVPPERPTPAYHLFGLQAGSTLLLRSQPLLLTFQVQNLFNTYYLNHISFYRLIALPEAGRNIVLSLSLPFSRSIARKPSTSK
ncbi:MAG: TonB-dependent receptor [Candidatus Pseudobacter hemicellulosilyticus]|uniref:TonB-dependent receptor n=1 Tax=Candidatus Pseudobacter hemicellulosilyticus TaxID=3121375 RepID=A0AAJ6BJZ0_9BACT|nr:MAG: TonB-dependent receptor [Pseudobacter sp.]